MVGFFIYYFFVQVYGNWTTLIQFSKSKSSGENKVARLKTFNLMLSIKIHKKMKYNLYNSLLFLKKYYAPFFNFLVLIVANLARLLIFAENSGGE